MAQFTRLTPGGSAGRTPASSSPALLLSLRRALWPMASRPAAGDASWRQGTGLVDLSRSCSSPAVTDSTGKLLWEL